MACKGLPFVSEWDVSGRFGNALCSASRPGQEHGGARGLSGFEGPVRPGGFR